MTSIAPNRKNGSGFSLLLNPQYFAVVFSHLMTDLYVGQRSIFLAFISAALGMSNTMLGLVTTLAVVSAGLSQPLFGYVADRIGARRMITIALIWTVGMFTLSILLPLSWAPVMLILANIGAGMYHPAGTTQAIRIGRILLAGRETTALSFFFLFGQTGFFLGPLIGGFLLNLGGEHALLALSVIGLPAIIFASRALRQLPVPDGLPAAGSKRSGSFRRVGAWAVAALVATTAFQAWSQQNISTFMPKHLLVIGQPASIYGLAVALFIGGTAIGNLIGGNIADRIGKRPVIFAGLALSSLPTIVLGLIPFGFWWFPLLLLAGALNGAAYAALVALGQQLAPGGGALASGLVLGFVFSSGALGALLTGVIVDAQGFPIVYILTAVLALVGGLVALKINDSQPDQP